MAERPVEAPPFPTKKPLAGDLWIGLGFGEAAASCSVGPKLEVWPQSSSCLASCVRCVVQSCVQNLHLKPYSCRGAAAHNYFEKGSVDPEPGGTRWLWPDRVEDGLAAAYPTDPSSAAFSNSCLQDLASSSPPLHSFFQHLSRRELSRGRMVTKFVYQSSSQVGTCAGLPCVSWSMEFGKVLGAAPRFHNRFYLPHAAG